MIDHLTSSGTLPSALRNAIVRITPLCGALCAALCWATPVNGQRGDAAEAYWRAFDGIWSFSDRDWDAFNATNHAAGVPSPDARRLRRRLSRDVFPHVDVAAGQGTVNFNLDYSQGYLTQLPHLAKMRMLAKLSRFDAYVALSEGDAAGATERMNALYRLTDHVAQDPVLISSLVSMAIFALSDEVTRQGFGSGALSREDAAVILDGARYAAEGDRFGMLNALDQEKDFVTKHLPEALLDESRRDQTIEDLFGRSEQAAVVRGMTADEIGDAVKQANGLMDRATKAFADDDRAALEAIRLEAESGERGLIALTMLPAMGRVADQYAKSSARLDARVQELEDIVEGRRSLDEFLDAALLYQRAVVLLSELPVEQIKAMRVAASAPEDAFPHGDDVAALLASAEPILALLDRAALAEQCEWAPLRTSHSHVLPLPVSAMTDLVALLIVDADANLARAEWECAAVRLRSMFAMSAHLSRDALPLSAMVAQDTFVRAVDLLERAESDGIVRVPRVAFESLRIPRGDPFGFEAAMTQARKRVAEYAGLLLPAPVPSSEPGLTVAEGEPPIDPVRAHAEALVSALSNEEAMCMLVMAEQHDDELGFANGWGEPSLTEEGIARVAEFFDLPTFRALTAGTADYRAALAAGGLRNAIKVDPVRLAGIGDRRARAMADLTRGLRAIEGRIEFDKE